jgi:H+/gluconate symporter-like permease
MKRLSLGSASLFMVLMIIYIAVGSGSVGMLRAMGFFALVGAPGVAMLAFELIKEPYDDR